MNRMRERIEPYAYALLRIASGLLFACHGAQKLLGLLGGNQVSLTSQLGLAGVIELVGGLMIAAGYLTSAAAFLASGQMAWAYVQAHAPRAYWPILNGGELAALYCVLFLYISMRGTGIWGISSGSASKV